MKIKIAGNEYGIHWGMPCLADACDRLDCTLEVLIELVLGGGEHTGFQRHKAASTLILCAIDHYARLHRLDKPDVTLYEVEDYRDITPPEEFNLLFIDFTESMINGKKVSEMLGMSSPEVVAEVKKKLPSRKKS